MEQSLVGWDLPSSTIGNSDEGTISSENLLKKLSSISPIVQPAEWSPLAGSHLKVQPIEQYLGGIEVVETPEQAAELLRRLQDTPNLYGLDLETQCVDPGEESPVGKGRVVCWSLAWLDPSLGRHSRRATLLARRAFLWAEVLPVFADWFADPAIHKVGHNLWAFDRHVLHNHDIRLEGIVTDTLRLGRLLNSASKEHGLKPVIHRLFGYKLGTLEELFSRPTRLGEEPAGELKYTKRMVGGVRVPTLVGGIHSRVGSGRQLIPLDELRVNYPELLPRLYDYASLDAKGTLELAVYQRASAKRTKWAGLGGQVWGNLEDYNTRVWNPFLHTLYEVERAGIVYDPARTEMGRSACRTTCAELLARIRAWTGNPEFNPASPNQLTAWLYDSCGYEVPPIEGTRTAIRRTERGKRPTTEASLAWLAANGYGSDGLADLQRWKKEVRLLQFLDKLPEHRNISSGRIHTILQPETATGRLSSRAPNLQQIPKLQDPYSIRRGFIAPMGRTLVCGDWSQLELYVLAHFLLELFQDDTLAADLATGDAHAATALRLGLSRATAKSINYGINYGKGALGLGLSLGISTDAAQELLDAHAAGYPGIKRFQDYCFAQAKNTGVVRTLAGRFRPIPEARAETRTLRNRAYRQCANTPIQGSAADIVIATMLKLRTALPVRSLMVLQVHDELLVECPQEDAPRVKDIMRECMENPFKTQLLKVSLKADINIAEDWHNAH